MLHADGNQQQSPTLGPGVAKQVANAIRTSLVAAMDVLDRPTNPNFLLDVPKLERLHNLIQTHTKQFELQYGTPFATTVPSATTTTSAQQQLFNSARNRLSSLPALQTTLPASCSVFNQVEVPAVTGTPRNLGPPAEFGISPANARTRPESFDSASARLAFDGINQAKNNIVNVVDINARVKEDSHAVNFAKACPAVAADQDNVSSTFRMHERELRCMPKQSGKIENCDEIDTDDEAVVGNLCLLSSIAAKEESEDSDKDKDPATHARTAPEDSEESNDSRKRRKTGH